MNSKRSRSTNIVRSRFSRIFWTLVLLFAAYLSLYTWNSRTGHLDQLTASTGLEFVGWVLVPGTWAQQRAGLLWERYLYHVHLSRENELLRARLMELELHLFKLQESDAQAGRLRDFLSIAPPEDWEFHGANVIGQRLGPHAVLETILVDNGRAHGIKENTPVFSPQGVVGRVHRRSHHFSSVLLITDPNSRIAVISRTGRTSGILSGDGAGRPLQVHYIPLNAALEEGDILVTSGMDGIFPKGLAAARVTRVVRSNISLFLEVLAEPLVELKRSEEVLLLNRRGPVPGAPKLTDELIPAEG
jgi:rod shape-determining protein MreC